MESYDWQFEHLDMSGYPEAVVEMTKHFVGTMITGVGLPVEDGWVRVTPEMLVLLVLQVADSAVNATG